MPTKDQANPFEYDDMFGWSQVIKFQEFRAYDAAVLVEFDRRERARAAALSDPADPEDLAAEQPDEIDDEIEECDRLFKEGLFVVSTESYDSEMEPTAAQVRAYHWLNKNRSAVFRILIDHAFQYYNENLDTFRDFFNGEAQDRELLLPKLNSPHDLQRLIRLIEIEIQIKTRDGQCLIRYSLDTPWNMEEYWDVILCGEQFTTLDSAPFPFAMPLGSNWEKLPAGRGGIRFAEFLYLDVWTGTFTITPQGVCERQILCPACDGFFLEDPELITAIREPKTSHMVATLVNKLELREWVRRSLTLIAPTLFLLGWSWNPKFFWAAIAVSLIAGGVSYIDAGLRRTRWVGLALLEACISAFSLLPKRETPQADEIPSWTVFGVFETLVWLAAAAIAGAWMLLIPGVRKSPILSLAYWNLFAFGLVQIAAVVFVAVTDYSALHLLWFIPLGLILTVISSFWTVKRSITKGRGMPFGAGGKNAAIEDAWRQMLEKMERGNQSNSVYESKPSSNSKRSTDDSE
jgi:hypothetical protein